MDFTPITGLKLKEAFDDQKKFQDVTCDADYLAELFEWSDRGRIFIHDDETAGHSIFVTDTNGLGADKTFEVGNPDHRDLFLWHIDGVLYKKDSKCDCAFLTESYIGFVEFKANAANNSNAARKENAEKAVSQLKQTILDVADRCKNVGVELRKETAIEAFAVFNRTVPRDNATQKNLAMKFLMDTDGILLHFKNNAKIRDFLMRRNS